MIKDLLASDGALDFVIVRLRASEICAWTYQQAVEMQPKTVLDLTP